jgi:zinc and cadmium transporter
VLHFYARRVKPFGPGQLTLDFFPMLLLSIVLGTATAGIGSVILAALISPGAGGKFAPDMLSFAAGALLSTACLHLLPEAFEGGVEPRNICITLLAGLVLFFVLDKAELWHHGHEHHKTDHHNGNAAGGTWAVLVGDSVHCFGDGLLIAAAFVADVRLGALASLAVLTHEIPHHLGDLAVVQRGANRPQWAAFKVAIAGAMTVIGGLSGYFMVDQLKALMPYFLTVASSSFVYVALADLIPQLQKYIELRRSSRSIAWVLLGIAVVALTTTFDVN